MIDLQAVPTIELYDELIRRKLLRVLRSTADVDRPMLSHFNAEDRRGLLYAERQNMAESMACKLLDDDCFDVEYLETKLHDYMPMLRITQTLTIVAKVKSRIAMPGGE